MKTYIRRKKTSTNHRDEVILFYVDDPSTQNGETDVPEDSNSHPELPPKLDGKGSEESVQAEEEEDEVEEGRESEGSTPAPDQSGEVSFQSPRSP